MQGKIYIVSKVCSQGTFLGQKTTDWSAPKIQRVAMRNNISFLFDYGILYYIYILYQFLISFKREEFYIDQATSLGIVYSYITSVKLNKVVSAELTFCLKAFKDTKGDLEKFAITPIWFKGSVERYLIFIGVDIDCFFFFINFIMAKY